MEMKMYNTILKNYTLKAIINIILGKNWNELHCVYLMGVSGKGGTKDMHLETGKLQGVVFIPYSNYYSPQTFFFKLYFSYFLKNLFKLLDLKYHWANFE